jgi:crossover junction endodeoxyribonuclease RuvC
MRSKPKETLAERLAIIFDAVSSLIEQHRPDALAVEGIFHGKNARSALILGHARGVVLLAGERAALAISEISPTEVKRATTGSGAATKEQVATMVTRLLHLVEAPSPRDASDGVAIALTHLMRMTPRIRLGGSVR